MGLASAEQINFREIQQDLTELNGDGNRDNDLDYGEDESKDEPEPEPDKRYGEEDEHPSW